MREEHPQPGSLRIPSQNPSVDDQPCAGRGDAQRFQVAVLDDPEGNFGIVVLFRREDRLVDRERRPTPEVFFPKQVQ